MLLRIFSTVGFVVLGVLMFGRHQLGDTPQWSDYWIVFFIWSTYVVDDWIRHG